MSAIDVTQNIADYMTGLNPTRKYTRYEVSVIRKAIEVEYYRREADQLNINTKTKVGRRLLNERTAEIANAEIRRSAFKPDDILLYKKCRALEYSGRTGKCAWGFPNRRVKDGYDPLTGCEIV